MGIIIENKKISDEFYFMKVKNKNSATMGQFYMLRCWQYSPFLSRPISVFDSDGETVSFLYKVVGEGTQILSTLKKNDEIQLDGPHGNGFPTNISGKIALVGGGAGIAPLFLAAKTYKKMKADNIVDFYLGFSKDEFLIDEFNSVSDNVTVDVGGYITEYINPSEYDVIVTCGPIVMMKALYNKCHDVNPNIPVYVSMENRMACGIGVCKVCVCKTRHGNKTTCKDGPVFLGSEVFNIE